MARTWTNPIVSGLCGLLLVTSPTAQTKSKQVGSFVVATATDPMTDAKQTTVMSVGARNELGLGWTCRADGTLVVIVKAQTSNLISGVQHRFGKQPPITSAWERGRGTATLAGEAAEAFTKEARQHTSVVVRMTPFSGDSVTDTIPLQSLGQALQQLPCRAKSK
jgi:hypothetical protein